MSEDHRIVEVRGEPLPAGGAGVLVRVRLSGCPSRQWSRAVSARLASELVGRAAVGHLRMDELVQDDQIALEGVAASEAPALADALQRAVDATNQALAGEQSPTATEVAQEAGAVAEQIAEPRSALSGARAAAYTGVKANVSQWFGSQGGRRCSSISRPSG